MPLLLALFQMFTAKIVAKLEPFIIESLQLMHVFFYAIHLQWLLWPDAKHAPFSLKPLDKLQLSVVCL